MISLGFMPRRIADFPQSVVRTVAQRAGYRCSRPGCPQPTIGPHSAADKSVNLGEAAHICAASSEGKRYDAAQTPTQRRSIENALWLCRPCAKLIDTDEARFPPKLLRDWKRQHEEFILKQGVPSLPEVVFNSINGRTLPPTGPILLSAEGLARTREHLLTVRNTSLYELRAVRCRIQSPEPFNSYRPVEVPAATRVEVRPDGLPLQVQTFGGGSVSGVAPLPRQLLVEASSLLPRESFSIAFVSLPEDDRSKLPFRVGLRYHILGSFRYQDSGFFVERNFIVALRFDRSRRQIVSRQPELDDGTRKKWIEQCW